MNDKKVVKKFQFHVVFVVRLFEELTVRVIRGSVALAETARVSVSYSLHEHRRQEPA